jgi:hypothetical protein
MNSRLRVEQDHDGEWRQHLEKPYDTYAQRFNAVLKVACCFTFMWIGLCVCIYFIALLQDHIRHCCMKSPHLKKNFRNVELIQYFPSICSPLEKLMTKTV